MDYKDWREFFARAGSDYCTRSSGVTNIWPVTVEEMYQHFRARLIHELTDASMAEGNDDLTPVLVRAADEV
jgi:hypothetical protein